MPDRASSRPPADLPHSERFQEQRLLWWRRGVSLLLFGLLTLIPLGLLWAHRVLTQAVADQREFERWEEQAMGKAALFRAGHTYADQLQDRFSLLRKGFRRIAATSRGKDEPRQVVALFRRVFPRSFRPPGTTCHLWRRNREGRPVLIRGPGLATRMGKILGDIFGDMARAGALSAEERSRLSKRSIGLFGPMIDVEFLAESRRGVPCPGRFMGRRIHLLWDEIALGGNEARLILIMIPQASGESRLALRHALRKLSTVRAQPPVVPILLPMEACRDRYRTIRPGGRAGRLAPRVLELLASDTSRNSYFPVGQAVEIIPGTWGYREPLSINAPYDICLISEADPGRRGSHPGPLELIVRLVWVSFWVLAIMRGVLFREWVAFSLRSWFLGFFLAVGAGPLLFLYALGTFFIDTGLQRQMGDAVRRGIQSLENIEAGSSLLTATFVDLCRTSLADPIVLGELSRGDGLSHERLRPLFEKFAKAGLPLAQVAVYPVGSPPLSFTEHGILPPQVGGLSEYYGAPILCILQMLCPDQAKDILAAVSANQALLVQAFKTSIPGSVSSDFFLMRQLGELTISGDKAFFQYHDFVASGGTLQFATMLHCSASDVQHSYVADRIHQLRKRSGEDRYLAGIIRRGSLEPIALANRQPTPEEVELEGLMRETARSGEFQRHSTGKMCFLAYSCRKLPGTVLGVAVSFSAFQTNARWQRRMLREVVALMGGLVILVGIGIGVSLLRPLRHMKEALHAVAGGNVAIRLPAVRDDELGDVARAFNEMIIGLGRRQELGRFVSGSLDEEVSYAHRRSSAGSVVCSWRVLLVSDLRSFTTITETYAPERVVSMLNAHLEEMAEAIRTNDGAVERFIGDAVVASFDGEDRVATAARALQAARQMLARHRMLQDQRRRRGEFTYRMGVGLAAGDVLIGSIGERSRREHVVTGDCYLRAEALEARSKSARFTAIVVDRACQELLLHERWVALGEDGWEAVSLGDWERFT